MVKSSLIWANMCGSLKNSITEGKGNVAGRLGELAFASYVGAEIADHKDFDLTLNGESKSQVLY